jgi:hypothetical protein
MRSHTLALLAVAALVLSACSDRPTGPDANRASDAAALRSIHSNAPFGPMVLPASGTLADGGTFAGEVEIRRIALGEASRQFIITGVLQGKATSIDGKAHQVKQDFTTTAAITEGAAGAAAAQHVVIQQLACSILNLDLGPLHLDLLGLVVDLAPVHLDITAQPGPGNLLGNLLCAIVSLLDFPGLLGVISQLLDAINQILAGLGGA